MVQNRLDKTTDSRPPRMPNAIIRRVEFVDPTPYCFSVEPSPHTTDVPIESVALSLIDRYQEAWDRLAD